LSHLVGLGALAVLTPLYPWLSPLALGTATTGVLCMVAAWETWSLGSPAARKHP
jgi:hypothetical protein